jgi:transcriptional/translational regulatory protein YebC/TACO1
MEVALENGAEDVSTSEMAYEVTCDPDAYESLKEAFEAASIAVQSADVTNIASNQITLDLDAARKVLKLMENLEEHDDVQSVSSNFDIPDAVMAELAGDS